MNWIALFEMILRMIEQCQENRSRRDIERGMNNPGAREYLAAKAIIKKEWGLKGKKLRKKAREAVDELRSLSKGEVREIMAAVPE